MAEISELELRVKGTGLDVVRRGLEELGRSGVGAVDRLRGGFSKLQATIVTVNQGLDLLRRASRIPLDIIQTLSQFESRLSNVSTLIEGDSTRAIQTLRVGILDLIRTVPKSADDLGAAAYQIFSAGVTDSADALKVLESSSKLAVAGLGTTTEAVDIVTSAMNAYGVGVGEVDRLSNIFFKTVKAGKTTVAELAAGFGSVADIAATYGVRLDELQAATAALTGPGVRAAEAQTRLRAAIISLVKPTEAMQKIFQRLGISNIELTLANEGLVPTMRRVLGEIRATGASAAETFGRVEGLSAALSLSGNNAAKFDATLKDMRSSTDSVGEAFGKQSAKIESRTQLMSNAFDRLKISIGEAFGSATNQSITDMTDLLNVLSDTVVATALRVKALAPILNFAIAQATLDGQKLLKALEDFDKVDFSVLRKSNRELAEEFRKAREEGEKLGSVVSGLGLGVLGGDLDKKKRAATDAAGGGGGGGLAPIAKEAANELNALQQAFIDFMEERRRADEFDQEIRDKIIDRRTALVSEISALEKTITSELLSETDRRTQAIRDEAEDRLTTVQTAVDAQVINQAQAADLIVKINENMTDKIKDQTQELNEFWIGAMRSMQSSASDFFFDAMQGNFNDMATSFKLTIDRMVADLLASQLLDMTFGDKFAKGGQLGGVAGSVAGSSFSGIASSFFPGPGQPGFGLPISSIFGIPFHEGGIVGSPDMAVRMVEPALYRHAQRYQTGGFAGLGPNEVPAILHRGEEVLTEDDPRHARRGGRRGGVNITMNISTQDANSFVRSRSQVEGVLMRAVSRGRRKN